MVKVFPNPSFSIFKGQKFVKTSSEPVAVDCSSNTTIIATRNCTIEVYSTTEDDVLLVAEFCTISPVYELVYNVVGNCIVTCETRDERSGAQARAYFNWFGASKRTAVRPRFAHTATKQAQHLSQNVQNRKNVEVVELSLHQCSPSSERVISIACCKTTGIFGVSHGKDLRLFVVQEVPIPGDDSTIFDVSVFADVALGFSIRYLSISHNFIAAISPFEVHILKWHVSGAPNLIFKQHLEEDVDVENLPSPANGEDSHIVMDPNFILWSSSIKAGLSSTSSSCQTSHPGSRAGSRVGSRTGSRASSPTLGDLMASSQFLTVPTITNRPQTSIGIITLKKVAKSSKQRIANELEQVTEVFGPIDYIRGVPATFTYRSHTRGRVDTSISTLFYKFSPKLQGKKDSSTSSGPTQRFCTAQLMPLLVKDDTENVLVGMGCMVTTEHIGYFYDIFRKAREVHNFSFINPGQMFMYDGDFLHIVNEQGLESYTTRLLPTCLKELNKPLTFTESSITKDSPHIFTREQLMCQFCPPSTITETMTGQKNLIGACIVSGSSSQVVVVTKAYQESSEEASKASSNLTLFQSPKPLGRKESVSDVAWNVYILEKQSVQGIAQEFVSTGRQFYDCSPPTFHGLLSEAHLLVRAKLLSGTADEECHRVFTTTCYELAQYFASKSGKKDSNAHIAASYLQLALVEPHRAVQLLGKLNTKALLMYLDSVLYSKYWPHQQLSKKTLETIWETYAEHLPGSLPRLLMSSWTREYDYSKALELLHSTSSKLNPNSILSSHDKHVTSAYLLCQLGKREESLLKLREVQELFLHQWCHNYSHVLLSGVNGDETPVDLTPFGKIVLESAERSFIDFVIDKVFVQRTLEFKTACHLLQKYSENHGKIQKFLEAVISVATLQQEDHQIAKNLLLEIYLHRLSELVVDKKIDVMESTLPCPSPTCPVATWLLNFLHQPDGGQSPKKTSQSTVVQYCHIIQDLVLVETTMNDSVQLMLESFVAKLPSDDHSLGILPVWLTVLYLIGKSEEAVELAAQESPSVLRDFVKCVCQNDPEKWKSILGRILNSIRRTNVTVDSVVMTAFTDLLSDSLVAVDPIQLLASLLPVDGDTTHFLSVIRNLSYTLLSSQVHKSCQEIFDA